MAGSVMLYMLAVRIPTEGHISIMDHPNNFVSQAWRIAIAPTSAIQQREAHRRRKELDTWIEGQRVIAWEQIASNIGPAAGAGDGIIIASPSAGKLLTEPDYYVCTHLSLELTD